MFSSISSYIWGQDDQGQGKASTASLPPSRDVNDWVVVGEFKHKHDGTKGKTNKEAPCEKKKPKHIPQIHKIMERKNCRGLCLDR